MCDDKHNPQMTDLNTLPPADRYAALARQFRNDVPKGPTLQIFSGQLVAAPLQIGVFEFENAIVLSGEWFVLLGTNVVADMFIQTPVPPFSAYGRGGPPGLGLQFETPVALPLTTAFLLGGCPNYAHWLLDYLPRIAFLPKEGVPLLVNAPLAQFQQQSLEKLGLRPDRLVALDYPGAYAIPRLLFAHTCSKSFWPDYPFNPNVLHWLRTTFLATKQPRRERKLFVSRNLEPDARKRRLVNENEIVAMALRHGFEVIAPETMTFPQQVETFSEAAVICGPHGAGLTNMVFASEGTQIIELIGPRHANNPTSTGFKTLADHLRQPHKLIIGSPTEVIEVEFNHLPFENYVLDPAKLDDALNLARQ